MNSQLLGGLGKRKMVKAQPGKGNGGRGGKPAREKGKAKGASTSNP